jgi:hypothetical protein
MDRLDLPDAELMTGLACCNHARTLIHWSGYYLANAEPSREVERPPGSCTSPMKAWHEP